MTGKPTIITNKWKFSIFLPPFQLYNNLEYIISMNNVVLKLTN